MHGIRRRSAASVSRVRVNAFSFTSISRRAASHASGETMGGVFMGVISCAMSLSLHEAFGEDLPGRQARGPHPPDLSLIDPGILLGRGGEANVCEDVEHRLARSRRQLAIATQRDPVAALRLDPQVPVALHAPTPPPPPQTHPAP